MYNSGTLCTATALYNHYVAPEFFHHPKVIPYPLSSHFSYSLSQPLAATILLYFSVDLPVLDILCEKNHTICGRLHLASFTSIMFSRFIYGVACINIYYFLCLLFSIFYYFYRYTTLCLSIYQLMDIWVISIFSLL